ncbi:MAG: ABC transporter permease [Candidatus Dormibacteraeota bacterium]|nr:ABC transporter permease [Candidatus Dormibacteraeota bacterium]
MSTVAIGFPGRVSWGLYDAAVLAWRNLLRVLRNPLFLLTEVVVQPVVFTLLFGYIFGGAIHLPGISYIDFLIPGVLVQTITFGSMNTAVGLAEDLEKGLMDRFRSLPVVYWALPVARVTADLVLDLVGLGLMIAVAYLIGFKFHGGAAASLAALGLVLLWGFAIACFGTVLGVLLRKPTSVQAFGFIAMFPLTFASSTFVPVQTMPAWLQAFSGHSPITAVVDAVRQLVLDGPGAGSSLAGAVAWSMAVVVVSLPAATYGFRRLTR